MSECCQCGELMLMNLAQMPCCGGHVHTRCVLQAVLQQGGSCPICHDTLVESPAAPAAYYYESEGEAASEDLVEQTLSVRMADPEFRAGVRAVRTKLRAAQRAVGAMNRRLTARAQEFRATVAPHVAAIRDAKREAQVESRLFPEVREAARVRGAALRAMTMFLKREKLTYWHRRQLFRMPVGRRRRRYAYDPGRRRFWIGI